MGHTRLLRESTKGDVRQAFVDRARIELQRQACDNFVRMVGQLSRASAALP